MATLWKGSIEFKTPMLFALGMLAVFLLGGVTGIHNGTPAADIYLHDTYFVVAHFHYALIPPVFFAFFAAFYFWFPKMFGRMMNEPLGQIHFWLTFLFVNLTFLPMFKLGFLGHQRRIADPRFFEYLRNPEVQDLHWLATVGVIGLLAGQIFFFVNLALSLVRGRRADVNPWRANTLEWTAPSPPPHGNFIEPPAVHRGPYEYSVPGRETDWLPQNVAP
jgi:cytochrome c oxidase subunit 1